MTTGRVTFETGRIPLAFAIGTLVLGALGTILVLRQRGAVWTAPASSAQRVTVDPFSSHGPASQLSGRALAESLAARLTGMPGLAVRVAGSGFGPGPDLTVGGDIALRDGRLVITARLFTQAGSAPLWTATYWRKDSLSPELVDDLSAGVAEAIAGHLVRRGAATAGARRETKKP